MSGCDQHRGLTSQGLLGSSTEHSCIWQEIERCFPLLLVKENALKANLISASSGIASCASTSLFGQLSSMIKYSSPDSLSTTAHDYKYILRAYTGNFSFNAVNINICQITFHENIDGRKADHITDHNAQTCKRVKGYFLAQIPQVQFRLYRIAK